MQATIINRPENIYQKAKRYRSSDHSRDLNTNDLLAYCKEHCTTKSVRCKLHIIEIVFDMPDGGKVKMFGNENDPEVMTSWMIISPNLNFTDKIRDVLSIFKRKEN